MKKKTTVKDLIVSIYRSYKISMKYAPWLTSIMAVTLVVTYCLPLLQSKILGVIIDSLISQIQLNPVATSVGILVLLYASVWVVNEVIQEIRLYIDKKWSLEIEQGLEIAVLQKRAELDLATHEDPKFQDLTQNAFSRGIWPVYQLVDSQFRNFANMTLIVLSSVIASSINWKLYIVAILSAIPSFYVQIKYGNNVWTIWAENSPRKRVYEHLRGHLRGRTGIAQGKLLQATGVMLKKATEILENFKKEQWKADFKRMVLSMGAGVLSAAGLDLHCIYLYKMFLKET